LKTAAVGLKTFVTFARRAAHLHLPIIMTKEANTLYQAGADVAPSSESVAHLSWRIFVEEPFARARQDVYARQEWNMSVQDAGTTRAFP
jgi:hypothetical protein